MKYIIIGNGPAGTTAAGRIRNLSKDAEIIIFSYEKYPYYARPRLPEIIEGRTSLEGIFVYKSQWYEKNNIILKNNAQINFIDKKNKFVFSGNEKYSYDKLLLAVGAESKILDIKGIENDNIYKLRSMEDALVLKEKMKSINEVIIIGGGLLGLELASSIISKNKKVKIIDITQCLLINQLEEIKGKKLQNILEKKGYAFYLYEVCEEIYKENKKLIIKTENGNKIEGDIVIFSTGIKIRLDLPSASGLSTERGIIVDKYLSTSSPDIYAAGDCIQFEGKLWGFVKSSIEQGNVAGENMVLNNSKEYSGTHIDVSLKVSGIDLNNL